MNEDDELIDFMEKICKIQLPIMKQIGVIRNDDEDSHENKLLIELIENSFPIYVERLQINAEGDTMHDIITFLPALLRIKFRVTDAFIAMNFKMTTKQFFQILGCHRYCKTINLSGIEWIESEDPNDWRVDKNLDCKIEKLILNEPKNMNRKLFKNLFSTLGEIGSLRESLKSLMMKDSELSDKKVKEYMEDYKFKIEEFVF